MRIVLVFTAAVALAAACGGHAPPPVAAAAAPSPPQSAPQPPPPAEAEIVQLSQEFLTAYDRADLQFVEPRLHSGLIRFDSGYTSTRDDELARLRQRKPGAPTIAVRTWSATRVRASADRAVFVGRAAEQESGRGPGDGYKHDGWYLLDWERAGGTWQVRLWTWQRVTEAHEPWNDIYRNGVGFSREPNRLLVEVIKGKRPGRALDIGMGQGRNTLHLAAAGWKVTGVDISDEGIRIARAQAASRKLSIETVRADVSHYDFGTARWDLITMIYEGADPAWLDKIKAGLRPGGLLVFEYFAKTADSDGPAPGELAARFTGFDILRDEIVEDVPDWRQGRARLQRFVARKR